MKKHGLNGSRINFKPLSKDVISKNDVIINDNLKLSLYCIGEDEFVIITNDPMNTFLTDKDLKREWYVKN